MRWIGAAAGAVLLMLLAACGGEQASDQPERQTGPVHSVSGVLGGTVDNVPDHPKRVVALWNTGTQLLELGIKPIGVLEGDYTTANVTPDAYRQVKDIPTVGTFDDIDIEKVLSLKPDLIVGLNRGFMTEKDIEPFEKVGIPTLIWSVEEPPDVWTNYPKLAKALGKRTDYATRDAKLNHQLAGLRKQFADRVGGTAWANVRGGENSGSFYVDTDQSLISQRLRAAGVATLPEFSHLGKSGRYTEELSYEQIPKLQQAKAIFYDAEPDGSPTDATKALLDQALWKNLPAVKAGNVFPIRQQFNYTFDGTDQQVRDFRAAFSNYQRKD